MNITSPDQALDPDCSPQHRPLWIDGPAVSWRKLVDAGLIITVQARRLVSLGQPIVLVELEVMRMFATRHSIQPSQEDIALLNALSGLGVDHSRRHRCHICGSTFHFAKDLMRHVAAAHDRSTVHYRCNAYGCRRTARRKDHMKQHCQKAHGQQPWLEDFTQLRDSNALDV